MMTNTYTPVVGGLEKSIQRFTAQFRKFGHHVTIVTPEFKGMPKKEVGVLRLPSIREFSGFDFSINLPIPGLLSKLVDSFKPDVVHAHHPFLLGDLALRLCGQYRIPLVYTYHTMFDQYKYYLPLVNDAAMGRFLTELSLEYANLADQVISPSESIRDFLIERGVRTAIEVVPTGIDVNFFIPGKSDKVRNQLGIPRGAYLLGHLGRLSAEKNLEFLAHAVLLFLKQEKQAHFLVAGKGSFAKTLRKIFRQEKVDDQVHFIGILKGKDLVDCYHTMDVFVFASQSETQGLVLAESMACGVPVVALDAPGVRDIVKNYKNGRLVFSEDEEKFSEALVWCFKQSRTQWKKMKTEARKTAEQFSIEKCAQRALHIYRSVKIKKYTPRRIQKNKWRMVMRRLKTEWDLFRKVAKATGATLAEMMVGSTDSSSV
ncbi:MAG: glycosyltransferase [Candidatus Omnitrophica bacterium]|nr:glycosyltransferase [Candidatus Omnitrophota bacterium]